MCNKKFQKGISTVGKTVRGRPLSRLPHLPRLLVSFRITGNLFIAVKYGMLTLY